MADSKVKMGNAVIDASAEPIVSMNKSEFAKHFAGKIRGVNLDDVWKEVLKKRPKKTTQKKKSKETE